MLWRYDVLRFKDFAKIIRVPTATRRGRAWPHRFQRITKGVIDRFRLGSTPTAAGGANADREDRDTPDHDARAGDIIRKARLQCLSGGGRRFLDHVDDRGFDRSRCWLRLCFGLRVRVRALTPPRRAFVASLSVATFLAFLGAACFGALLRRLLWCARNSAPCCSSTTVVSRARARGTETALTRSRARRAVHGTVCHGGRLAAAFDEDSEKDGDLQMSILPSRI